MKRRLLKLVLLAVLAAGPGTAEPARPADPPLPVDEIVRRLQDRYDRTSDFTADFVQKVEVPALERTLESHGRVYFMRPGRMRWEFVEPEPQTIVADGKTLWIHQPDQNQVLRTPFRAAFRSQTPISFLFGVGKLEEDFEVSVTAADEEKIRLRLESRQDAEIGLLVLIVSRDTYDLRGAEVTDPLGNLTRLELANLEREVGLDDSTFRFEIPEGADVVDSPELFGEADEEMP